MISIRTMRQPSWILYLFVLFFSSRSLFVKTQLTSICPRIVVYDTASATPGHYSMQITLISDVQLQGTWIRMLFDKPFYKLTNYLGEINTEDNKDYLIKNRNNKVVPNSPQYHKLEVDYDASDSPPQVVELRLNARTVCPEGVTTTTPAPSGPQVFTSKVFGGASTRPPPGVLATRPPNQAGGGNSDSSQVTCGQSLNNAVPLISHGQATVPGEWPWHVAMYHARGIQQIYQCGGTLVSTKHIITAGHCVAKPDSKNTINPKHILVYFAKYHLNRFENVQDGEVSKIFLHPDYVPFPGLANDIAIVKLDNPVQITDKVRPCCLWEGTQDISTLVKSYGTVVGWGYNEYRELSPELIKAEMPIVDYTTCIVNNRAISSFITDHTYCAGYRNGTAVCSGDSGGGMYYPRPGTSGKNTIWQIRGVVSIGLAYQGICDQNYYSVFVDTVPYLKWIQNIMKE